MDRTHVLEVAAGESVLTLRAGNEAVQFSVVSCLCVAIDPQGNVNAFFQTTAALPVQQQLDVMERAAAGAFKAERAKRGL